MFLEKVSDIWEPARGFLVLLRYNSLNEEQIDDLFRVFKSVVNTTSDEIKKRKLKRAISTVELIKRKEVKMEKLWKDLDEILQEM